MPQARDVLLSERPLVSVLIPCFNAERFVEDAVRSALEQTYPCVEVIVVDDGSVDGTVDLLRSFGANIRWKTGPNRGAPAARNEAIAMAKGDVLQFLDADDVLYPSKFAEQVPVLVGQRVDSVWCDVDVVPFDGENCVPSHVRWRPIWNDDEVLVALGPNPGAPSPMYTASIIKRIDGFRTELSCAQDRDLHLRVACAGARFAYVPHALVKMRRHSDSLSANFNKVLEEYERVIIPAYRSLDACDQITDARAAAFAGFMASAARGCIRLGDHAAASAYLKVAQEMHVSGGIGVAYGRRLASVRRLLGPWHAERLARSVQALRRVLVLSRHSTIDGGV